MTRRGACRVPPDVSTENRPSSCRISPNVRLNSNSAPALRQAAAIDSTSRAACTVQKICPYSRSSHSMPNDANMLRTKSVEQRLSRVSGKPFCVPTYHSGDIYRLVTFPLPPPARRTLRPATGLWSMTAQEKPRRPAVMAHMSPAAPAPRMMASRIIVRPGGF